MKLSFAECGYVELSLSEERAIRTAIAGVTEARAAQIRRAMRTRDLRVVATTREAPYEKA